MTLIDTATLQAMSPWGPQHTLEPDSHYITEQLHFETKAEYLEWRAEWRQAYKDLSQEIRDLRAAWRAEKLDHEPVGHRHLFNARALARTMLVLRKASKVKAEQLYKASKAPVEV